MVSAGCPASNMHSPQCVLPDRKNDVSRGSVRFVLTVMLMASAIFVRLVVS